MAITEIPASALTVVPAIAVSAEAARAMLLERALADGTRVRADDHLRLRAAAAALGAVGAERDVDRLGRPVRRRAWPSLRRRRLDLSERLLASGLLLPRWYAARHGLRSEAAAIGHFRDVGIDRGLAPNPLSDPDWYAHRNGVARGAPAFAHYLDVGAPQALPPGPLFDPVAYMHAVPDAAGAPDLLVHFLRHGIADGRLPEPVGVRS